MYTIVKNYGRTENTIDALIHRIQKGLNLMFVGVACTSGYRILREDPSLSARPELSLGVRVGVGRKYYHAQKKGCSLELRGCPSPMP